MTLGLVGKLVVAVVICLNNVGGEDSAKWGTACGREGVEGVFPRLILGKWCRGTGGILLLTPHLTRYTHVQLSVHHQIQTTPLIGTFLEVDSEGRVGSTPWLCCQVHLLSSTLSHVFYVETDGQANLVRL